MAPEENAPNAPNNPVGQGSTGRHDFSAEPDGFREVHESTHDALAKADPTNQQGKPLLLVGFILVMVAVLAVMLVIGVVVL